MTLAASLVLAVESAVGLRSMPVVGRTPPVGGDEAPRVSIIVAARNEERHIEAALGTLLAQDYPTFEVVVVNDRSTDRTGAILERMAGRSGGAASTVDPRLRILHIEELPPGWLGKNHALQRGAEAASGEVFLFTDADVMLRPDALGRAVGLLERAGLDHLAVAPRLQVGGPWATMTVAVFTMVFGAVFRPWKASDPTSRAHVGIGAFNLVRAGAYRAIGGHEAVALRPDDDVRLGRRLKEAGYAQAAGIGRDIARVEWYPSLRAMARGLRKNSFAAVDYRLLPILGGTLLPVVFDFWPVLALVATGGVVLWLNALIVAVGAAATWDAARAHGLPRWVAFTYPLGALFLLWIVWSAVLSVLRSGGIEWRGTRYSLEELRRGPR